MALLFASGELATKFKYALERAKGMERAGFLSRATDHGGHPESSSSSRATDDGGKFGSASLSRATDHEGNRRGFQRHCVKWRLQSITRVLGGSRSRIEAVKVSVN